MPIPQYAILFPFKFFARFSYYINGSFYPPKEIREGTWEAERIGYGIYNPIKDLQVSKRLFGL
jgi:hypothetical protein